MYCSVLVWQILSHYLERLAVLQTTTAFEHVWFPIWLDLIWFDMNCLNYWNQGYVLVWADLKYYFELTRNMKIFWQIKWAKWKYLQISLRFWFRCSLVQHILLETGKNTNDALATSKLQFFSDDYGTNAGWFLKHFKNKVFCCCCYFLSPL